MKISKLIAVSLSLIIGLTPVLIVSHASNDVPEFTINEYIECELIASYGNSSIESSISATGGKYLMLSSGGGRVDQPENVERTNAEFKINIPEDGNYTFWIRTLCTSDSTNSFWMRVDDGDWKQYSPSVNTEWISTSLFSSILTKGVHTIYLHPREPKVCIDFLYVSKHGITPPVHITVHPDGSFEEIVIPPGDYKDIITDGFETGTPENIYPTRRSVVSTTEELLQRIAQGIFPGDEILLDDGQYTDGLISLKNIAGTKTLPIRIAAKNPGKAILTGNIALSITNCSYIEISGLYFKDIILNDPNVENVSWVSGAVVSYSGSSYCRLTNNYFERCGNAATPFSNVVSVRYGSDHNRFDHNTFDDPYSMQIALGASTIGADSKNTFNRIDHNHFVNVAGVMDKHPNATTNNGMESVQLGQALNEARLNTIVEYNLFENVKGDGSEIISGKSNNNVFRYNTFYDCYSGPTIRSGDGNIMKGNYFYHTYTGWRVYGKNHLIEDNYFDGVAKFAIDARPGVSDGSYKPARNILIQNNTIMNTRENGIRLNYSSGDLQTSDITVKGNKVISAPLCQPIIFDNEKCKDIVTEGNIVCTLSPQFSAIKSEGIKYVTSVDDIDLPTAPKRLTTDDAGTTWKKGINTNTTYVEKRDKIVAFSPKNINAYNKGSIVKLSDAPTISSGVVYLPANSVSNIFGIDISGKTTNIDGVDMVNANVVKNAGYNMYSLYSSTLIVFTPNTPENITINSSGGGRYPDVIVLSEIMQKLGGFENLPIIKTFNMGNMTYFIDELKKTTNGVNVNVFSTTDSTTATLYIALYDGTRLHDYITYPLNGKNSMPLSFTFNDMSCVTNAKAYIWSNDDKMIPYAISK